ncbi:5688_t:CDS:2 [Ambispora leptoticha]|uniref:5688_t:CDS:1 n=1 Tax=Ambispora leptoticha TaxID=144679 RepID=A0A9N8VVN9_9GLOM|nr:5688_t:CDS:2 [Ambispora leptoticha]
MSTRQKPGRKPRISTSSLRGKKAITFRQMEIKWEEIKKLFDFNIPCGRLAAIVIKALLIVENRPSTVTEITDTLIDYGLSEHDAAEPSKSIGSALTKYFRNKRKGDPLIREIGERGRFFMSLDRNHPGIAKFFPPTKDTATTTITTFNESTSDESIPPPTITAITPVTSTTKYPLRRGRGEKNNNNSNRNLRSSSAITPSKIVRDTSVDESQQKSVKGRNFRIGRYSPISIKKASPRKITSSSNNNKKIIGNRTNNNVNINEKPEPSSSSVNIVSPSRKRRVILDIPESISPMEEDSDVSNSEDNETTTSSSSESSASSIGNHNLPQELNVVPTRRLYNLHNGQSNGQIVLTSEQQQKLLDAENKFAQIEYLFNFDLPGGHLMKPIVKTLLMLNNQASTVAEITDIMVQFGLTVHNAEEPAKSISSSVSKYFKKLNNDPSPLQRVWQRRRATLLLDESIEQIARVLNRPNIYLTSPGGVDSSGESIYDTASEMNYDPKIDLFTRQNANQNTNQHVEMYSNWPPPSPSPSRSAFSIYDHSSAMDIISISPAPISRITVPAGQQVALTHDFHSRAFSRMDPFIVVVQEDMCNVFCIVKSLVSFIDTSSNIVWAVLDQFEFVTSQ